MIKIRTTSLFQTVDFFISERRFLDIFLHLNGISLHIISLRENVIFRSLVLSIVFDLLNFVKIFRFSLNGYRNYVCNVFYFFVQCIFISQYSECKK